MTAVVYPHLTTVVVSLIIGLIFAGLIIDLGGGPNHERIGFRVSSYFFSDVSCCLQCCSSTGKTQAHSTVLVLLATSARIAFWQSCPSLFKLLSHSKEWNLSRCELRI